MRSALRGRRPPPRVLGGLSRDYYDLNNALLSSEIRSNVPLDIDSDATYRRRRSQVLPFGGRVVVSKVFRIRRACQQCGQSFRGRPLEVQVHGGRGNVGFWRWSAKWLCWPCKSAQLDYWFEPATAPTPVPVLQALPPQRLSLDDMDQLATVMAWFKGRHGVAPLSSNSGGSSEVGQPSSGPVGPVAGGTD